MCLIGFIVFKRLFSRPKESVKPNAIGYKLMGPDLAKLNEFNSACKEELLKREYENVHVKTKDGLTLNGYVFRSGQDTGKVALLSHGFNSTCFNSYASFALFYLDSGFDVLMINHRAHEKSEGKYATFAVRDSEDIKIWLDFAVKKFPGCRIVMHGSSMGAAAVVQSLEGGVPENVKCVISDCAFNNVREELAHQTKFLFKIPSFPILNVVEMYCKRLAGFGFDEKHTLDIVKKTSVPVMFVHGTADKTVPVKNSTDAYEACASEKKLVLYEGTGHGQSYFKNREDYQKNILEWTSRFM